MKIKITSIITVLLLLNSCGIKLYHDVSTQTEIDQDIDKGYEIINALGKYYEDNNRFPEDLYQLVPEYLEEIPRTTHNKKYQYMWSNIPSKQSNSFDLYFEGYLEKTWYPWILCPCEYGPEKPYMFWYYDRIHGDHRYKSCDEIPLEQEREYVEVYFYPKKRRLQNPFLRPHFMHYCYRGWEHRN